MATAQTHFLFNGSFYDQIDGVAMGSPLAPVIANLFMGHHEKSWLENSDASEILFYRRYVDDTFCLFHSENDALLFFHYINSRHPNIRFTMEKEADHRIPFLDVLIRDNNCSHAPITSIYRKKIVIGLLTNYFSFTSHIPTNLVSSGHLLTEPTKSIAPGLVFTKTSSTSLKFSRRTFSLPILLKGLLINM